MMDRAVVFDMDGVLIDSEPFWVAAEVAVLTALGVEMEPADCARTKGLRVDAAVLHWLDAADLSHDLEPEATAAIVARVAADIRAGGQPLPGIMTAYRSVQHSGRGDAIATSSPMAVVDAVVERLYLQGAVVCSAMDEVAGKPDPAVYLTAARHLGLAPSQCLAVEDSVPGVAAARAAGMKVVAVEPVEEADWVVPTTELAAFLHANWLAYT